MAHRALLLVLTATLLPAADPTLARRRPGAHTRWSSFENPTAAKGAGGAENRGAKGHAFDAIAAGETKTLLDVKGAGEIRRIWFTVRDRDPEMLRSMRLDIYWDGRPTPAVSVPAGDFFGAILGRPVAFENELFSDPEGRSFNCYIPMPFRTGARVTVTNESARHIPLFFYDIDTLALDKPDADSLYFHASWHRERWTTLGRDFELLPHVQGEGRFLGVHVGVITHPDNTGWWGEGEVKMYVDGDKDLPTIIGTGTEDYIGTGWGQGVYHQRYQGSLVSDAKAGQYAFYRYHIPDPVYFHKELRVTMQQIGGDPKDKMTAMQKRGVAMRPVSVDQNGKFTKLNEAAETVQLESLKAPGDAWVNAYRRDDWSAVALFYLDKPENGLPALAPVALRTEGLK
ncbi:MAG: DUF2961 domain-containing protein [Bryobacterales bacterium]|nr:DUF2961 domain-containing protein [Bryobacterales bacterium]